MQSKHLSLAVSAITGCAIADPWAEAAPTPIDTASMHAATIAAEPHLRDEEPAATAQPDALAPEQAPRTRCPHDMALVANRLGDFCVDRFEAGLVEIAPDGSTRRHPYSERPVLGHAYRATSEADVFPQAFISRDESEEACAHAGKRLCSRAEWQRACRHRGLGVYPYGNERVDGACNTGKPPLLPRLFPEQRYLYAYDAHFNAPALALEPGFMARTAEYGACVSDLGTHDMVGNLHEWVGDHVTRSFLASFEIEARRQWQPAAPGNGMFMGGFYSTSNEHGAGCNFTTVAHEPSYHDYSTGFRCCAEAR